MHKLIEASVIAAIGVLVFASLLIPVVDDATATTDTFKNNGVFDYGIFTPTDEYTLEYDVSTNTLVVNDTPITGVITGTSAVSYSLISSDNFLMRYGYNNNGYYTQVIGKVAGGTTTRLYMATMTATIDNGQMSITGIDTNNTERSEVFDFDEIYAIVPTQDEAVLKVATEGAYILGDSELYASGLTTVTQWSDMFHFEGTYNDGITITSPNTTATFDNIVWNIEPVSGYVDLYKLTSIEFDITINDTTVHATYSYFGVPSSVTAEKATHADEPTREVLEIMPLILIAGLIIGVLGYAVYSRIE